jgi:molecular chaperone HtpG
MARILKMAGREIVSRPRILEINPTHTFVKAAAALADTQPDADDLGTWIELLHDQAHLAEGEVPDPAATVKRIQSMLDRIVTR